MNRPTDLNTSFHFLIAFIFLCRHCEVSAFFLCHTELIAIYLEYANYFLLFNIIYIIAGHK